MANVVLVMCTSQGGFACMDQGTGAMMSVRGLAWVSVVQDRWMDWEIWRVTRETVRELLDQSPQGED